MKPSVEDDWMTLYLPFQNNPTRVIVGRIRLVGFHESERFATASENASGESNFPPKDQERRLTNHSGSWVAVFVFNAYIVVPTVLDESWNAMNSRTALFLLSD